MLRRASTYTELRTGFRWSIPARYNIGTDICDRHVSGNPLALIYLSEGAGARRSDSTTFGAGPTASPTHSRHSGSIEVIGSACSCHRPRKPLLRI